MRFAYVDQRCHECGHNYAVTLEETLLEQRALVEWQSQARCEHCRQEASSLTRAVPKELLEQLEHAWHAVAEASRQAGLDLLIGDPERSQTANT